MNSRLQNHENSTTAFGPVAGYYDTLMAMVPYDEWLDYLHRLWFAHGLRHASVMDIACGTGSVANLMADEGIQVVGIDLSEDMLIAAERTNTSDRAIVYLHQDAADLDLPKTDFDAAICLFDSLNYILDERRLKSAFNKICSHLNVTGSLIFDVNTEVALAQGMFNQSCSRKSEPLHYRWRARYDDLSGICTVSMRFQHTDENGTVTTFSETHRQRAYSTDNITIWLKEAGFGSVFVYDAYTLEPAKEYSDRLFFVAIKN